MKTISPLQFWIGIVLVAFGSWVLMGWALHQPGWVQLRPEHVAMVINTALCFGLLGIGFLAPVFAPKKKLLLQGILGWMVVIIAAGLMFEIFTHQDLGIDWHDLHAWLKDGNPHPGRMAFNTALGFILAGFTLILSRHVASKPTGIAIQIMTFIVLLLGLTGLLGYLLQLELLYGWFSNARMALSTAIGMMLVAMGLMSNWYRAEWYRTQVHFREDEKIALIGAALLIIVAITTGIAGFAFQQKTLETTLSESLPVNLRNRTIIFQAELKQLLAKAESGANRPRLIRLTRDLIAEPGNAAIRQELNGLMQSLLIDEARGIAIYDLKHQLLVQLGSFSRQPQLETDLGFANPTVLFWDGGLMIRSTLPIRDQGETIGTLVKEATMPLYTHQLMSGVGLGKTGETGLCRLHLDHMLCYPQSRNPKVYRANLLGKTGQPTPMGLALQGKRGIYKGLDYRGKHVIAAHAPLWQTGLGIVVKKDTEELFLPIREQL